MHGTIWFGLLNSARIAWGKPLEDFKKAAFYHDDLTKFDGVWGGNELIYDKSNDKIVCHNRVPKVSLVDYVYTLCPLWGLVAPSNAP